MRCSKTSGQFQKKAAALAVSLVMVMGMAAALPDGAVKESATVASAWDVKQGHTFYCEKIGPSQARITGVVVGDKSLTIPSEVEIDGTMCTVTEIGDNFAMNGSVFALSIPDSVVRIGDNFARYAKLDNITLSKNIEYIGDNFCSGCTSLRSVNYSGDRLKYIGSDPFGGEGLMNSHFRNSNNIKGAVCLGNWVIAYYGKDSAVNISELGNGTQIVGVASNAFTPHGESSFDPTVITQVDLSGVRYLGEGAFKSCSNLETITNGSSIEYVGPYAVHYTKWYANEKNNNISKLGKVLMWYMTDGEEIDLTEYSLRNTTQVYKFAFVNCQNAKVLKTRTSIDVSEAVFGRKTMNDLYTYELFGIEDIYINGNKVAYDSSKPINETLSAYSGLLEESELEAKLIDDKTKAVFEELGIKYYGIEGKASGLTVRSKHDITKKIHDYICQNYTFGPQAKTLFDGYIAGQRMDSEKFATLYAYMLRCAGIESMIVANKADANSVTGEYVFDHSWTMVKLGNNWYHSDVCWDSASQGNCDKYFLMSDTAVEKLPQHEKWELSNPMMLKVFDSDTMPKCGVQIGDTNGDGVLSSSDLCGYKDIIQGKAKADANTDLNFDGKTDINDMFYLDEILSRHPNEPTNTDSKPANSVMAKNGKIYDLPTETGNSGKVIIASDSKIYNDEYLTAFGSGMFVLPEFTYETSVYETFDKWDLGAPGDEVQLTREVTILRPLWVDDAGKIDMIGDVNFDGTIDIVDALTIISHINAIHSMSNKAIKAADVNKDNLIDIEDVVLIIGYINAQNTL